MHELGIAESALKAALKEMSEQGASRIQALTLRIGDLAAVDPAAMRFAFRTVVSGTAAEQAQLTIEHVHPIAWCRHCAELFSTDSIAFFACPRCGNFSGELRQGREIELARLELES